MQNEGCTMPETSVASHLPTFKERMAEVYEREAAKAIGEEERRARAREEGRKKEEEYRKRVREYEARKNSKETMREAQPLAYFIDRMEQVMKHQVYCIPSLMGQAREVLAAAYKREVEKSSGREPLGGETLENIIGKVAQWLTSEGHKSGLMMRGNVGVGKTTLLNALKSVIDVFDQDGRKLRVVTAWKIANQHKEDKKAFEGLKEEPLLGIDDLGTEPTTVKDYGNDLTPLAELLTERYEKRRMTVITTNLSEEGIKQAYGERVYDRLCELCNVITFPTAKSYRQ